MIGHSNPSLAQETELAISPLFSSDAVVQRNEPIRFWGTGEPGTDLRIDFAGETVETAVADDGTWLAAFPPLSAGGPHMLRVVGGDESAQSDRLLVGDVWLCSGQSNMGWRLAQSTNGPAFIEQAGNDSLRLMQMNRRTSHSPIEEPDTRGWRPDRDSYAQAFSAVGYHFGRLLQEKTDVPIGMIEATWGGTPAEAWTPEHTLRENTAWAEPLLEAMADYDLSPEELETQVAAFEAIHAEYIAGLLEDEAGEKDGWAAPGFDDSDWTTIDAPGFWEPTIGSVDGVVWLRKQIMLSDEEASADAVLELGMIEEYDDTYVNGVRVGGLNYPSRGAGRKPRSYAVPADVLRPGSNTIAVRAIDTRTAGGFGSTADMLVFRLSGRDASLAGSWKIKVSHNAADDGGFPLEGQRMVTAARQQRRPSALYNGMIHQLTEVPVRGFIWYQGESNNGRAEQYGEMFPAMIESWRSAWQASGIQREQPFMFVQLPNYRARKENPEESGWADLREAQAKALMLPGVGMAVTIDVGQADDIHPRLKLPVAERLAAITLANVYGFADPVAQSPSVSACTITSDGQVWVELDHASGLRTIDGRPPQSFALAGADGRFVWADAKIVGEAINVWHADVPEPVEVRYAWAWNPDVNVVNGGDRPMAPFRWRLDTAGPKPGN